MRNCVRTRTLCHLHGHSLVLKCMSLWVCPKPIFHINAFSWAFWQSSGSYSCSIQVLFFELVLDMHFSCGFFCFPVLFTWECGISKLYGNYWVVMYIVSCISCSIYRILLFHLYVIVDCCLWKFMKHIQIYRLYYNMCLIARFRLKVEMQNI